VKYSHESSNRKEWLFVGYVAAFFSVYAAALLGALVPNVTNQAGWTELIIPSQAGWAYTANSTMSTGSTLTFMPLIGVALLVLVIAGMLVSTSAFSNAQ